MPTIEDVNILSTAEATPSHLAKLGALLISHNLYHPFTVDLVHRHSSVNTGERAITVAFGTWVQPVDAHTALLATRWALTPDGWMAYEYDADTQDLTSPPLELLAQFATAAKVLGLRGSFGLGRATDLSQSATVEVTIEGRNTVSLMDPDPSERVSCRCLLVLL